MSRDVELRRRRRSDRAALLVMAAALVTGFTVTGAPAIAAQSSGDLLREARAHDAAGRYTEAISLYDRVLAQGPDDLDALTLRANARYRSGQIAASLSDFDRIVELAPGRAPYLWQRGIAQYQVGRFEACARQFDVHRTVNPADVENAAWHFLCVARARGVEAAREELLPVGRDARVPMAEVYELFAGRADRTAVLESAAAVRDAKARSVASLYARLYLGLYAEAHSDVETSRRELRQAVELGVSGYMADVARLHLELIE